jgi:hypothetical protein
MSLARMLCTSDGGDESCVVDRGFIFVGKLQGGKLQEVK